MFAGQGILAIIGLFSMLGHCMTGIEKLLDAEGGKPSAVAEKLTQNGRECSRQLVEYWAKRGYVTGTWAPFVNRVYGIPLHELNKTIYPRSAA
jgi:hypothetical protein